MAAKKQAIKIKSHILRPKHSKLNQKQKKELLDSLGITIRDLPKISIGDAALAEMDIASGDIIKIERDSPTAGRTIYYRGVIGE